MQITQEIPNCPFCGKEAKVHKQEDQADCSRYVYVYYGIGCSTHDCHGQYDVDMAIYDTPEAAIAAWSKRQHISAASELLEALENLTEELEKIEAWDGDCPWLIPFVRQARAVINKARGQGGQK